MPPCAGLRYFCSPHHQDSALYPVIAQQERAAGFSQADTAEAKLAKLRALLGSCLPTENDADARSTICHSGASWNPAAFPTYGGAMNSAPDQGRGRRGDNVVERACPAEDLALIAELHALHCDVAALPEMMPQKRKEKTFDALLRQIERLAQQRPVLIVFEDIHWIDPSSRELLDRMIECIDDWPVLLIATFRQEFTPPWTGQSHVTMLALGPLDKRDSSAMIETNRS